MDVQTPGDCDGDNSLYGFPLKFITGGVEAKEGLFIETGVLHVVEPI